MGPPSVPPQDLDAALVRQAWSALGASATLGAVEDISATVSTNRVYQAKLDNGQEVIAKTSSYGSYVHFRQDHQLIRQWRRQLKGYRFRRFLAPIVERDGQVFTYRAGGRWVVFYEKAPFYDFLPKVLSDGQVESLAREMALFHRASAIAAKKMNASWKSIGSDTAALFDSLEQAEGRGAPWVSRLDDGQRELLWQQCERCLVESERLGYHEMTKLPVLLDWNIGNFSVGLEDDGFRFFSRWDYDWFRMEPRTFDFYFAARVVRAEGDKTAFSYSMDPLFEDRFVRFLRVYHEVYPLEARDVLFLKEAYRFFLLNYVLRVGEHFFRPSYCARLQREVLETHLPRLEQMDFTPLCRALD